MAADEDDKASEGAADPAKGPDSHAAREKRQKPPVTIDLAAESVRPKASDFDAKAAQAPREPPPKSDLPPPPNEPSERKSRPLGAAARAFARDDAWRRSAAAGVVGGLIAFLLAIMLQAVGLLPAPGRSVANQAMTAARDAQDQLASLDRRTTAMEAMTSSLPTLRTDLKGVDGRATALEAKIPTLATRRDMESTAGAVDVIRQQLDKAPAAPTQADLEAINERVTKIEVELATVAAAGGGGGEGGVSAEGLTALAGQLAETKRALAALGDRVQEAEGKVAALGTGEVGNGAAALRAMALLSLRRAASGGQPFEDEVDGLSALGGAPDLMAKLRAYATTGVASATELASAFPDVADAILAATAKVDPNAGFLGRALNAVSHLVSVRPAGPVEGSDPPAIVSRMRAAVDKGDLAAALNERRSLPESGLAASADWVKDSEARVALDQLVEDIARGFSGAAGTG